MNEEGKLDKRVKDALGFILAFGVQIQWLCEDGYGYWLPLDLSQEEDNGIRLELIVQ